MLEKIKKPSDIKKLSLLDLRILAKEVRKRIIDVTSNNGGHLAPSLGATDIAIALLKVFNPKKNRIVWDVGHQAYAYKILTERNEKFDTLRQFEGLGGFNDPEESPYDAFRVGHSSTSVSAALGISMAKEMQGEKGKTIAIIGDGALTGGMAFEALNHTGHLQKQDLIVILNDNKMSISKNVGGLQNYLTSMLVSKSYNSLKKQVWDISQNLPKALRNKFISGAQKLEESLINILVPNILFEDLGFKYVGPIDGHNISRMIRIFNKVKNNMIGPVFIHLVTNKGKGCDFAEQNATKFHGLGPYNAKTGDTPAKNSPSYSSVFGETLCKLAESNNKITAITAAMCDGTGLKCFANKFPDRFFDVGIAEQHAVTFAAGMAIQGLKPFVAIYSTFMQRSLDQIIHDVALQKLPVVLCLDRAGLVGEDGPTHHGTFDLSYLNFIPNLTVMAPSSSNEFELMLEFASQYNNGPIAIRYPRGTAPRSAHDSPIISLGKSSIIETGKDVAIIGIGTGFNVAELLSDLIKDKDNKKPYLIDARFLKPLDTNLLDVLRDKVSQIITIEENSIIGGYGSSVRDYFSSSKIQVFSYGIPDKFVTHGATNKLKEIIGLTPESIYNSLKEKEII